MPNQAMERRKTDFDVVRKISLALPGVEQGTLHGAPSWKVKGRLLTSQALDKSAEPNTLAVRIDFDDRAALLKANPNVFYLTDHYKNSPTVLVRLSRIDHNSLENLLQGAWHFVNSKRARRRDA